MKNACEEKSVFHILARADFYEASGCLNAIKQYKQGLTSTTMVKNAIIAYSRPFMPCRGIHIQEHRLKSKKVVPKRYRSLHDKVLRYRNRIVAHTDLAFRNPKLVKYGMMIEREGDYLALGDEMQALIREVCSAVHNMVIEDGKK
jgi:hypothetical protein